MKLPLLISVVGITLAISGNAYPYMGYCSEPSEPSCVDMLGISRDEFSMSMCRSEIESYLSDIETYIDCRVGELEDEQRQLRDDADRSIERFNCYARGEDFCP